MSSLLNFKSSLTLLRMAFCGVVVGLAVNAAIAGDNKSADKKPAKDDGAEAIVRHAIDTYVADYNHADAKAVADHWHAKGEMIGDDGSRIHGRDAIQKEFETIFRENTGLHLELLNLKIRRLSPNVFIEEGTARVTAPGKEPFDSNYVATHLFEGGQWKLDNVRDIDETVQPSHREKLQCFEGLIGRWIDKGKDSTVTTEFKWSKNGNYVLHTFKISAPNIDDLEGQEIIAWDPANHEIRSWMFDSDGGFGEATWKQKGSRLTTKIALTLQDGRKASAVNIYRVKDANAYTWESLGRQVEGERLPNIPETNVIRQTTAKKAK